MFWLFATLGLVAALGVLGPRLLRRAPQPEPLADPAEAAPEDVPLDIGDELDLHGVAARDVVPLVEAFVDVSRQHGRRQVRIVHGKGIGQRRQEVRRVLERHPGVASFGDDTGGGGWGATVVRLLPPAADVAGDAPSD